MKQLIKSHYCPEVDMLKEESYHTYNALPIDCILLYAQLTNYINNPTKNIYICSSILFLLQVIETYVIAPNWSKQMSHTLTSTCVYVVTQRLRNNILYSMAM